MATTTDTLLGTVLRHADTDPDRPLLSCRSGDAFVHVSAKEVADTVYRLAAGLIGLGIQPGDRVALLSRTRIEWTYLDYAILAAGAVTVPIYETSSAEQIEWILRDSDAVAAFVETPEHATLLHGIRDRAPLLGHTFTIENGGLDDIAAQGLSVRPGAVDERIAAVTSHDLATVIYTSGTTGPPKGCMLTHGNLTQNVHQVSTALDAVFRDDDSTLLFLPLAHSFAKIVTLVLLERGATIGYATGLEHITEELLLFQPTFVVAVPRVFERVYNKAQQKAAREGKGRIFAAAASAAVDFSEQQATGKVRLSTRVRHRVFDRLVYGKLRAVFGGRLRYAVSGGAPLGERLGHFFNGVGVTVLEGYGLTETSPVISVNTPDTLRVGTVGPPVPGTEVRIADDGEIVCRGGQVFQGYWRNEAATRAILDADGWLYTGDLGEVDEAGRLRITGRKKDLIVTAGGKNVAPATLEDRLRAHPLISDSVVFGDRRPYIAALIALDGEALAEWAAEHGREVVTADRLCADPDVLATINRAVHEANQAVSQAERIRSFKVLPRDFSISGGELTPTMKVRRAVVLQEYADVANSLYD
jgi:long-chain acyl-CoA synthetase